jgi:hypothetical protein
VPANRADANSADTANKRMKILSSFDGFKKPVVTVYEPRICLAMVSFCILLVPS